MSETLRNATAAFRRAPLLMAVSVVAVGLSLFVIGLFALVAFNIRTSLDRVGERVEVVAYLDDAATLEQARRAEAELRTRPEVQEVRYVSRVEALATAVRDLPEFRDLYADLEVNPLPASLEVRLQPGSRTPEAAERVAEQLQAYAFVEDVHYGREWVERIVSLQRIAAGATLVIGGAFAAVAAIIIGTAVRIAVFARREEIEIMRLVGATDGFIRRPFLLEGAIAGVVGGVLAIGLTYGAFRLVGGRLLEIEWIPASWLAMTVLAGALYGFAASAGALRRHLRAL
jgi:cell division transport system permease protein